MALGVFLFAMLFWYGGGVLRAETAVLLQPYECATLIVLFSFVTLVAYRITPKNTRALSASTTPISHLTILAGLVFLILFSYFGSSAGGMTAYHTARLVPAAGIMAIGMAFATRAPVRFYYVVVALVSLLMAIDDYSRRPLLTITAAAIIFFILRDNRRRLPLAAILLGFAISITALVFATGLRDFQWSGSLSDLTIILSRGVDVLGAGQGFDTVTLLDYVLQHYPLQEPYLYGDSVVGALVNPIPRILWEGKPIGFGVHLASEYFGVAAELLPTNFGPGIVAEAYANGGWLGVTLWGAMLGYGMAKLDSYVSVRTDAVGAQMIAALALPALFFLIRGDLLNAWYEFFVKAAPVFLLLIVAQRKRRERRERIAGGTSFR